MPPIKTYEFQHFLLLGVILKIQAYSEEQAIKTLEGLVKRSEDFKLINQ